MQPVHVFYIFASALLLRLLHIYVLDFTGAGWWFEYSPLYLTRANLFLEHGRFVTESGTSLETDASRLYGYVLLLAGLTKIFGDPSAGVVILQAFLDSISTSMIAVIAGLLYR